MGVLARAGWGANIWAEQGCRSPGTVALPECPLVTPHLGWVTANCPKHGMPLWPLKSLEVLGLQPKPCRDGDGGEGSSAWGGATPWESTEGRQWMEMALPVPPACPLRPQMTQAQCPRWAPHTLPLPLPGQPWWNTNSLALRTNILGASALRDRGGGVTLKLLQLDFWGPWIPTVPRFCAPRGLA